jgi:hypothetical protein
MAWRYFSLLLCGVGEIPRETDEGGNVAEEDILAGFPGDAQNIGQGINLCHGVCEETVFLGSAKNMGMGVVG